MNTTKSVPNDFQVQKGTTWVGGPTHQLQRQHIPGYSGHVHGLHAQNIHGKNFARVTGQCLNQRNQKGIDLNTQQKYRTSYQGQFTKPDLRRNQLYDEAEKLLQQLKATEEAINRQRLQQYRRRPKSIQQVPPIDRMPVVGYMGYRPTYRPPQKEIKVQSQPQPIQLPEIRILEQMLENGQIDEKILNKIQRKEPIVGYGGFLKGIKSENEYGKTFKDLARTSFQK